MVSRGETGARIVGSGRARSATGGIGTTGEALASTGTGLAGAGVLTGAGNATGGVCTMTVGASSKTVASTVRLAFTGSTGASTRRAAALCA